jgi:CRP-like cAMP-binding protein
MKQLTYGRDDIVFREGEFALTMYEIKSGAVGIYANYDSTSPRLLATLGQSEYFGEMGLAECYPRSATAVAMEDGTTLEEIDSDEFSTYFQNRPDAVLAIMRALSARLRETNARLLDAQQTIHDAIEAEHAGKRKSSSLVSKLTSMLGFARRNKKSPVGRP